jgi:hypothetical protein
MIDLIREQTREPLAGFLGAEAPARTSTTPRPSAR